jgi:hypothetical protein
MMPGAAGPNATIAAAIAPSVITRLTSLMPFSSSLVRRDLKRPAYMFG